MKKNKEIEEEIISENEDNVQVGEGVLNDGSQESSKEELQGVKTKNEIEVPKIDIEKAIKFNWRHSRKTMKIIQEKVGLEGREIDGTSGPITVGNIIKYQQENGLKVDGMVGEKTLEVMNISILEKKV